MFFIAPARAFTIYTVTRTDDPIPDSCLPTDCSLREAVRVANATPGADLIILAALTYTLNLTPTKMDFDGADGDLDITDDLIIQGTGAASTIIDGNHLDAILIIRDDNVTVTLNAITLRNGSSGYGGAIYSDGNLTLNEVVIRNNTSPAGPGGAIYVNYGSALTLNNSTITGNSATGSSVTGDTGGGIYNLGTVRLNNSTVSGNRSQGGGGGLANSGGVIYAINSTISDNRTDFNGGGILNWNAGRVELFNVTIAGNVADNNDDNSGRGGGLLTEPGSPVVVRNSLIGNNFNWEGLFSYNPDDCAGTLVSGGGNLVETMTNCTLAAGDPGDNITGQDPKLDLLAGNGGSTRTHALQPGSPAIDAGTPSGCRGLGGSLLTTDQRGYPRPVDGDNNGQSRCDIGAVEFGAVAPAPQTQPVYLPIVLK
ncbi:MAG: CSLREA domain-containing protein [Anaerolineae bacterium]